MTFDLKRLWIVLALVALCAAALAFWRSRTALPGPGSQTYEQITRAFYHGLAALDVGLLDDARQQFTSATNLVEREPAAWANLGLAELRLGNVDGAAAPIERALTLAPDSSDVVLLAGRMEIARGRLDDGVRFLRRAAELNPDSLRARFALAEELERLGTPEASRDAQAHLDEIVKRATGNLAAILERARLAATLRDVERLRESVTALDRQWPPPVAEQYAAFRQAVESGNFDEAARAATLLRNVMSRVPEFIESLVAVRTPAELIAEPFRSFLVLPAARAMPSAADASVTFASEPFGTGGGQSPTAVIAFPLNGDGRLAIVAADSMNLQRLDSSGAWPFPAGTAAPSASGVLALDWNRDFRNDLLLAGRGGLRLLLQDDNGFVDVTSNTGAPADCDCFGAWALDYEMDGDLDVVAGATDGPTVLLQNNGDGTWRSLPTFASVNGTRAFAWADLDRDTDPDAVFLDAAGAVHVLANRQAGTFAPLSSPSGANRVAALTVTDLDADGTFDIVTLGETGSIQRITRRGDVWDSGEVASWPGLKGAAPGAFRLVAADLDNNGALDLIASGSGQTRAWLGGDDYRFQQLSSVPAGEVFTVADLNGDGRLDLTAVVNGQAVRLLGRGQQNYHWKAVRTRAQQTAGDQRINAFGVGGEIEARSGLLVQKQVLSGMTVHVGLGTHDAIDVVRIVWPNGVPQAEFGTQVDDVIVAEQRLKGSCPWVFAWNGNAIGFVTDFLWRSPLGLRINAQDTAGVSQTEDWVRIRGDQLAPRDGSYDVRITAELWETHFFDHVSLLAVDHPADTEVLVDERFSPASPPALAVQAVRDTRPVLTANDDRGRDVTDLVSRRDGRYLASFERGDYQGIARSHYVEFEFTTAVPREGSPVLVASGWIYPTDSSINVAIGQGSRVRPEPVALEALGADGRWNVVAPDVGYPAGKNKTMLVDLSRAAGTRKLRLRTNLEIYWDSLAIASAVDAPLRQTRLQASTAELRFRGYSQTVSPRGEIPETPQYDRLANTTPRWRDLEGYYTRFGNVNELLAGVDDRYVIMNAGDELRLLFPEQPAPATGWRREFVLIGDGWEKDGDYNTGFSQTVLPLPAHDKPAYGQEPTTLRLEDDPVYRRHPADWERFHTRYVTPRTFVAGLRPE